MESVATEALSARPRSARVFPTVSRLSIPRRPKSARAAPSVRTARTEASSEDDDDDDLWDEEEPWLTCLEGAQNAKHGMQLLYAADKDMFYLQGDVIYKMLQYRFENELS